MDMFLQNIVPTVIGIAAFVCAWAFVSIALMQRYAPGGAKIRALAAHIQEAAHAWLHRQYAMIAAFAALIFFILAVFFPINGWHLAVGFLAGVVLSSTAGYIGMGVAVRANARTAEAAKTNLPKAFTVAFSGAAIAGFLVASLALVGISGFFYYLMAIAGLGITAATGALVGFGFGASLVSLFARVGGGVFSKAADLSADLVGTIEVDIPADDPRNPATIADAVGDNVGDCVGMGADLFETYTLTTIAAMLLAAISLGGESGMTDMHVLLPLALGAVSLLATFIGMFFVRLGAQERVMRALYRGMFVTAVLAAIGFYIVNRAMTGDITLFYASLVGYAITLLITLTTEYYTADEFQPVREVAQASETGAGTNLIAGLATGMRSTGASIILLLVGAAAAFSIAGYYGIAVAGMAMLSLAAIVVALDAYGSITDNADGIAEMTEQSAKTRAVTSKLDVVGNTAKAATKGYAIGAAALAGIVLFQAYGDTLIEHNPDIDITSFFSVTSPAVLIGLFVGGLIPFIFSAACMRSVHEVTELAMVELRRQFREITGITDGTGKPDYAACVDLMTRASLRSIAIPAAYAIGIPVLVGYIFGAAALAGLLLGVIISGLLLGLTMINSGGAWDNAKKYVEDGNYGGKGSPAHAAATIGDTLGDPCKDTAGPAINALIKITSTVALILAALLANWNGFISLA